MFSLFSIGIFILSFTILRLLLVNQYDKSKWTYLDTYVYFILVLFLIVLGGIRGPGTGIDDTQYLDFFQSFNKTVDVFGLFKAMSLYRYEPVTYLIAIFSSFFSNSAFVFLLVYCACSVLCNTIIYKRYSPYPLVSLVVYFSHLYINKELNQIRFGLASAFFVMFVILYANRYLVYSMVFFTLSILTHYSAAAGFLIIPALFLCRGKRFFPLYILLLSVPIGIIGGKSILTLLHLNLPIISEKLSLYEGTKFDYSYGIFSLGNLKNVIYCFVFCLYLLKDKINDDKYALKYALVICYAIGGSFRIAFSDFGDVGTRLGNLFLHVEPILIAFMFCSINKRVIPISLFIFTVVYYLFYNLLSQGEHPILGYSISTPFLIF